MDKSRQSRGEVEQRRKTVEEQSRHSRGGESRRKIDAKELICKKSVTCGSWVKMQEKLKIAKTW